MNYGTIQDNKWVKNVNWNKAVLWMKKKISFNLIDVGKIRYNPVKYIEFFDRVNGKVHRTTKGKLMTNWKQEQYGQEPQYYCPIEIFETYEIQNSNQANS